MQQRFFTDDGQSPVRVYSAERAMTLFARGVNILLYDVVGGEDETKAQQNTINWRKAILAAAALKTKVYIPEGIFMVSPLPTDTANGINYILSFHEVPAGGHGFNNILMEGVDGGKRLSRIDTTPHQTWVRGSVIKVVGDMTNKVAIQNGISTQNVRFKDFTLVGTGFSVEGSIGIRHCNAATQFECQNLMIQHFQTGLDVGGDWQVLGAKGNADLFKLDRVSVYYCEYGFKMVSWASYYASFMNCDVMARVCIYNSDTQTTAAKVNVYGGFYSPESEWGGKVIAGIVTGVAGQVVTVDIDTITTKYRDVATFATQLNTRTDPATTADVKVGMFAMIQRNCVAYGASRIPTRGVMNRITAVDAVANTITVAGYVNPLVVGEAIDIVLPGIIFYGENFNVNGCYGEQRQIEDKGMGSMIACLIGFGSGTSIRNCVFNLFSSGSRANAIMPLVYHEATSGIHSFQLSLEFNSFNALYANFEVSPEYGVFFKCNRWYVRPIIKDHSGLIAENVVREGDSHLLKTRFPYEFLNANIPYRDAVHKMGSDKYRQINGILKRDFRVVTTPPTSGSSGEVAVIESSPNRFYTIGMVAGIPGFYSTETISANVTITTGSTVATVDNLTGIYEGRVVSILGIGTTRVEQIDIGLDGSLTLHLLHPSLVDNVTPITGVNPVIESALAMGRADATTPQLVVLGGSQGNDLAQFNRTDGATTIFAFRMGAGTFIIRDSIAARNLLTLTSETGAIAIRLDAGMTLKDSGIPAAPPAGFVHIFPHTVGGKMRISALFPTGAAQLIATEP